jgi:hypothetical protein
MTTKHIHHEVITAYLEGKQVEFKNHTGMWEDVPSFQVMTWLPAFHIDTAYRIKKIKLPDLVRNLKLYYDDGVSAYNRVKIRVPEHWETANLQVVIDPETGDIKQVTLLK